MPLYDYDCSACGHRVEVMHGVYAEGPATCPVCGSDRVRKAFAAPAVHFKGSGWAKKERRATSASGSSKSSGSDQAGGDGGATGGDRDATGGDRSGTAKGDGEGSSSDGPPAPVATSTTPASAGAAAVGSD